MAASVGAKRSFLFLQGLATPFWTRLGDAIAERGHAVHRINVSGGDRLFWRRPGAVDYRGKFANWRNFLGTFLHDQSVTDIVLFGDCRPYHRVALDLARSRGIATHIFEEGYFRPDWITLERSGTNAFSSLPRTAEAIYAADEAIKNESPAATVSGGVALRVRLEIANQIATMALAPFYPHYRRHRPRHPLVEMCGWLNRLARRPSERRYAENLSQYLGETRPSYFLLPLQLDADYQIRSHSPFSSMAEVMRSVLESFARSAPTESLLVVKVHPLDNGLVNYRKLADEMAAPLGLGDRVKIIDGGHLPTLLSGCEGVIVVNSTTALSALHHQRPVAVLGNAIFNLPGLVFQGPLDAFWQKKTEPDRALFAAFRRVVLAGAQINGSFFTEAGIELAIQGTLDRLRAAPVPQPVLAQPKAELPAPALAAGKAPALIRR